jgi:hypothetical protein
LDVRFRHSNHLLFTANLRNAFLCEIDRGAYAGETKCHRALSELAGAHHLRIGAIDPPEVGLGRGAADLEAAAARSSSTVSNSSFTGSASSSKSGAMRQVVDGV